MPLPTPRKTRTKDANAADDRSALPAVVTPEEWQKARDALLVKEKRATRALGRQADWEDSPAGWPQTPAYWRRLHDEYPPEHHRVPA